MAQGSPEKEGGLEVKLPPPFALITKLEHKAVGLPKGAYIAVEPGTLSVSFESFASPDEAYALADALTALAQQCRTIAQRLNVRTAIKDEIAGSNGDRLLNIHEAASKLGRSEDWLYRNADKLPFTVRNPDGRGVQFSEQGIEEDIRTRRKGGRG
jgi:hypothetical protein